jgi:hypothetical protein
MLVKVLIDRCGSHIERDLAIIVDTFVLYLHSCFFYTILGKSQKAEKSYEGYGNT